MDIVQRLRAAIHLESAEISPQTSPLIEAAKEAVVEIERLRETVDLLTKSNERLAFMSMGLPAR